MSVRLNPHSVFELKIGNRFLIPYSDSNKKLTLGIWFMGRAREQALGNILNNQVKGVVFDI